MARNKSITPTKYSVAIIGEGPTEWHYFNDMRQYKNFPYKLSPELPKHSDYKYIFEKARRLVNEGYDKVYCVLDIDVFKNDKKQEEKYFIEKRKLLKNKKIAVVETMPCIEYWFLLHFKNFSTKIYPSYASLKTEIKTHLTNYEKSNEYFKKIKLFQTLVSKGDIEKAYKSALSLREKKKESDNHLFPFSDIDILLKKLF